MKKIIFTCVTIIALLISSNIIAQQATLDFFVGTWRYTNAGTGEEFTIKLRKTVDQIPPAFGGGTAECVVGTYTYKKNGVVILDNMEMFNGDELPGMMPIFIGKIWHNGPYAKFYVRDYGIITRNKPKGSGQSYLTIISSTTPKQIHWEVKGSGGVVLVGINDFPAGFSIPTDIILTQVEE